MRKTVVCAGGNQRDIDRARAQARCVLRCPRAALQPQLQRNNRGLCAVGIGLTDSFVRCDFPLRSRVSFVSGDRALPRALYFACVAAQKRESLVSFPRQTM
jgi:hypothetical protein